MSSLFSKAKLTRNVITFVLFFLVKKTEKLLGYKQGWIQQRSATKFLSKLKSKM